MSRWEHPTVRHYSIVMKDVHVFEVYTSEWRQEWGLDNTDAIAFPLVQPNVIKPRASQ